MRFFVLATFFLGASVAFSPMPPAFGVLRTQQQQSTAIFNGEADSSLDVHNLRSLIDNLKPDNFDVSLEMMEPLLMNECVGDECEMYLEQLKDKCGEIGKELPSGFAPTHH
jgi:predicted esterase